MGRLFSKPGYRLIDFAQIIFLASVYCGLAAWVLTSTMTLGTGNVTILWLPGGMALASLLIGGLKLWPSIFLGAFFAGLVVEDPIWVSAVIALGNLLETIAAALALKHSSKFDSRFRKPSDFIELIKIACLSAMISAVIGPIALFTAGFIKSPDLVMNMLRWWQADALGIVLVVPLILIWQKLPENWFNAQKWLETFVGLTLVVILNQIVFADWLDLSFDPLAENLWLMPLLIWVALRRGTHGVTLFVTLTAIQAFQGASKGVGYFASDMNDSGLLNLWLFILMISLVGIGLALTIKVQQRLKHHLESIINSTSECIKLVSQEGKILSMNPAGLAQIDAESFDQIKSIDIYSLITAEFKDAFQTLNRNACNGIPGQLEFEVAGLKGRRLWMDTRVVPFYDELADETVQLAFTRDISERKEAEKLLTLAASVFKHVQEPILITDANANIIDVNAAFSLITGYKRDEVIGKNPRLLQSSRQPASFYADMWKAISENGFWEGEIWNRIKSGQEYAFLLTISAVPEPSGKIVNYIGLLNDITTIKNKESRLENLAHYDQLTGLPNRLLLMDRLHQAMINCDRKRQFLAVVFIDLDGFKSINDDNGHAIGDQMLIIVSQRLKHALRDADTLARLGGDEFIGILVGLENIQDVEPVLDRLLEAASHTVNINDLNMNVTTSMGVSFYPQGNLDADQLIRHADQAMYQAKNAGKNRYHFFSELS